MREENATIRHADAIVYLFDIDETNEFSKISETMAKVEKHVRNDTLKLLIGHQEQEDERSVTEQEA
jgi:hypothetical protein